MPPKVRKNSPKLLLFIAQLYELWSNSKKWLVSRNTPLRSAGGWSQRHAWQCAQSSVSCRCCDHASSWSWSDAPRWDTEPCGIVWPHNVLQSVAGTWHTSLSQQCNPVVNMEQLQDSLNLKKKNVSAYYTFKKGCVSELVIDWTTTDYSQWINKDIFSARSIAHQANKLMSRSDSCLTHEKKKKKKILVLMLTCREMSLIWTSSVLHLPKSLISGVSATAVVLSQSVTGKLKENAYSSIHLRYWHLRVTCVFVFNRYFKETRGIRRRAAVTPQARLKACFTPRSLS